jgi:glycolate oxidase
MKMPEPDRAVMGRREAIIAGLRAIVPGEGVVWAQDALRAYESDALTAYRQRPLAVVLPRNTAEVVAVLQLCARYQVKVVPRGSGTSLSGGALPLADSVVVAMGRFNRILDIDIANRTVTAQPGVTNLGITAAVADAGFYYAPDPSSRGQCGGKFGRRALPEIRPHHQQCAWRRNGLDVRRDRAPGRQISRPRRL